MQMTTDERLDAIANHLELLTVDHRQFGADVIKMRGVMDDLLAGFATRVDLVRSHELRIEKLERR
jgi:hypothetical protein